MDVGWKVIVLGFSVIMRSVFVEVAAATYLVFKWSNFIDLQNNLIRIAT